MVRFLHILILTGLLALSASAQYYPNPYFKVKTGKEGPYYKNEWYFGISLATGSSGEMVRYGVIKIFEDGHKEITWLTQKNFIMQASGQQPSKANKNKENFFEIYKIQWNIMDQIWKLRYNEWPYDDARRQELGWSGKMFVPSDMQWAYLKKNYGYGALTEFLYGDNLWKLLQDMQDENWISQYSGLK